MRYTSGTNRLSLLITSNGTTDYSYTPGGQVSGVYSANYTYDANGNPTSRAGQTTVIGSFNRLMDDGTYSYLYDAEGRMTLRMNKQTNETEKYAWNQGSQLTQIDVLASASSTTPTKTVRYGYDQLGRRSMVQNQTPPQSSTGGAIDYLLSDGDQVAEILGSAGNVTSRFLYGPDVDMVLAEQTFGTSGTGGAAQNPMWQMTDQLGTVRGVAQRSASGTTSIENVLRYDAFGMLISQTNSSKEPTFGFAGRDMEPVGGLTYNRNRYYSTSSGRFISQDPISFNAGDANLYRYVGNSATNATDPSGLQPPRGRGLPPQVAVPHTPPYPQQIPKISDEELARYWEEMERARQGAPQQPNYNGPSVGAAPPEMIQRNREQRFEELKREYFDSSNSLRRRTYIQSELVNNYNEEWTWDLAARLSRETAYAAGAFAAGGLSSPYANSGLSPSGPRPISRAYINVIPYNPVYSPQAKAPVKGVPTPYGVAEQQMSQAALAARSQVEQGANVYRIGTTGKSQGVEAQFWSLEPPTAPGFAGRYGVPPENVAKANFVEVGKLKPGTPFITRQAPGVGTNPGGGIEIVVPENGAWRRHASVVGARWRATGFGVGMLCPRTRRQHESPDGQRGSGKPCDGGSAATNGAKQA